MSENTSSVFDLSSVKAAINEFNSPKGGNEFKYQILYPSVGQTEVKLLFNPASNLLFRQVYRHQTDDGKVACMRTYGKDCPICAALDEIKNATGTELHTYNSRGRFISFAQFIGANYEISNDKIKKDDVILLMYPWSVWRDIQNILAMEHGDYIDDIIGKNKGNTITITHSPDNSYSAQLTPSSIRMPYQSFDTDEEYERVLKGLESLNDKVLPAAPDVEMEKKLLNIANDLRAMYLRITPEIPKENPAEQDALPLTEAPKEFHQPSPSPELAGKPDDEIPFDNGGAGSPSTVDGKFECYGDYYKPGLDRNNCMLCPDECDCMKDSTKE